VGGTESVDVEVEALRRCEGGEGPLLEALLGLGVALQRLEMLAHRGVHLVPPARHPDRLCCCTDTDRSYVYFFALTIDVTGPCLGC